MTSKARYQKLIEASWRRRLTAAEESELQGLIAAEPQLRAEWEGEAILNDGLAGLKDAPVPGNFTSRVLQAVKVEEGRRSREAQPVLSLWLPWRRLLRKAAFVSVVLAAGLLSYHKVNDERRARLVESVAAVSEVSSLPSPEILQDFDAIQAMTANPPADEQLLVIMQ